MTVPFDEACSYVREIRDIFTEHFPTFSPILIAAITVEYFAANPDLAPVFAEVFSDLDPDEVFLRLSPVYKENMLLALQLDNGLSDANPDWTAQHVQTLVTEATVRALEQLPNNLRPQAARIATAVLTDLYPLPTPSETHHACCDHVH